MNFKTTKMKPKAKQKQKLTLRRRVITGVLFLSLATYGMILFFNLNRPDKTQAINDETLKVIIVKDQELLTEKSIDAPRIMPQDKSSGQVLYVKSVKREINSASN